GTGSRGPGRPRNARRRPRARAFRLTGRHRVDHRAGSIHPSAAMECYARGPEAAAPSAGGHRPEIARNQVHSTGPGVRMRRTPWLALYLALASTTAFASGRPSTSVPPVNQPLVGPQAALERYAEAFRDRSPDGVGAVLTSDFRFHEAGDSLASFWAG